MKLNIIEVFVLLGLLFNGNVAQSNKEIDKLRAQYIGLNYSTFPKGCESENFVTLHHRHSDWAHDEEFYLQTVQTGKGKMIWFERLAHRDSTKTVVEILDVLFLPQLSRKERVILGDCFVGKRDTFDTDIFGIIEETGSYDHAKLKKAWRANRVHGKIEILSTDSVTCKDGKYLKE